VTPRTFLAFTFVISAAALVAQAQTVSPDGSSITPSSGGSLVTADGTWTFGTATVAQGSPVYNSPVNFAPIKGGWGPPGFVIPSSSNHSDP
jgi:hypothetical protein